MPTPDPAMLPRFAAAAHYVRTEKGIYFRFRRQSLHMEGPGIYPFFQRILPYLDGKHALAGLLENLQEQHGRILQKLVHALHDKGFIRDMRRATALDDSTGERHAELLAGLEGSCDDPEKALLAWLKTRILAVGSPRFVSAVRDAAGQTGVPMSTPRAIPDAGGTIFSHAGGADDLRACLHQSDIVIIQLDQNNVHLLEDARRHVAENGGWLVPAGIGEESAFIGPCESRHDGGCLSCAGAPAAYPRGGQGRFLVRTAGGIGLYEAYIHVTGSAGARSSRDVTIVNARKLTIKRHACTPALDCPRCAERGPAPQPAPAVPPVATEEELQRNFLALSDRRLLDVQFGLLESLDEGGMAQFPLRRVQAALRDNAMGRKVLVGCSVSPVRARVNAVLLALEAWCANTHPELRVLNQGADFIRTHAVAGINPEHALYRATLKSICLGCEGDKGWQPARLDEMHESVRPLIEWLRREGADWQLEFRVKRDVQLLRVRLLRRMVVQVAGQSLAAVQQTALAALVQFVLEGNRAGTPVRFLAADEPLTAIPLALDAPAASLTRTHEVRALDARGLGTGFAAVLVRQAASVPETVTN